MMSWRRFLPCVLLLALLPACGAATPPPEAKAPQQKKASRDPQRDEERTDQPRHVAPPPAYGNKVVLANANTGDQNG